MLRTQKAREVKLGVTKLRHKRVIDRMLEGVGKTDKEILEKEKYSPKYAGSGNIKNTRTWKVVSEEKLPNDLLADRNNWLLNFTRYGKKYWQAVSSGLDKAYKAKKIYTNGVEITNKYDGRTKEELVESILRKLGGAGQRNR